MREDGGGLPAWSGPVADACSFLQLAVSHHEGTKEEAAAGNSTSAPALNGGPGELQLPARPCADLRVTGFEGDGVAMSCAELAPHCDDADIGPRVQTSCPSTCGKCPGAEARRRPCVDQTDTGFAIGGISMGCPDLISYCEAGQYATLVAGACPRSCGVCEDSTNSSTRTQSLPAMVRDNSMAKRDLPCKDNEDMPCSAMVHQCNSSRYGTALRHDCPVSCGYCTDSDTKPSKGHAPEILAHTATASRKDATQDSAVKLSKEALSKILATAEKHCADNLLLPCSDMVSKCNSSIEGRQIKSVCPKTCGTCGSPKATPKSSPPAKANSSSAKSDEQLVRKVDVGGACADKTGVTVDGVLMPCVQLVSECNFAIFADEVRKACPKTCGVC